ncbi:uracil-DNA glycosylase (plasmid) [Aneurinibacillus sp. Ricciae_BoGa-3]|uniref:uracil-DNA glycosylase n=1 Tax=Aneurinibacillus sp. Ricciae_BoGa-3 TaxID=3022697 RepID=UPI00234084EE|nr:uracil-DNA glycosylase [Aneurinibacillus sp. Ricciae_BoGa-3]WCK57459.1 uracil-DNA glycosylase [Aneurinibacillus sp. Ricciae_BoGa-3]
MILTTSQFFKHIKLHPSWEAFFSEPNVQEELVKIESLIGQNYTPQTERVLRFATVDLQTVTCVILGKDPYPQPGVATGRSFEVSGVTSWFDKGVNSSLKNVIKLIHKVYTGREVGAGIGDVRQAIQEGSFAIPTPDKAFSYWEEQGVLFLNTAFTCEVGGFAQAGSHLKIWKPFFLLLLKYMAVNNPNIRYFLWGDARKYAKNLQKWDVDEQNLYMSKHPCTNGDNGGYRNGSNFLECPCFEETKETVRWILN